MGRSCPTEEAPKLRPLRPLAEHVLIVERVKNAPRKRNSTFQVQMKLFRYSLSPKTDKKTENQRGLVILPTTTYLESTRAWI